MLAELPPELNPLGAEQEPIVEPDIIVKPEPVDDALPGTSSPLLFRTLALTLRASRLYPLWRSARLSSLSPSGHLFLEPTPS